MGEHGFGAFDRFQGSDENGDGFVGATIAATPAATITAMKANSIDPTKEEGSYFITLLGEQLISNAVLPLATTSISAGAFGVERKSFLPNTAFPNTGLGISAGQHPGDTGRDPASALVKGSNWLAIWSSVYTNGGGVSIRQAGHIDTALDDAIPDTGIVRGDDSTCNSAKANGYDGGATVAATTDVSNPTCVLLINMGPN